MAATVATLPLVAFYFHRVPTLGVLVTLLAVPAMPLALGASAVATGVASLHSGAGEVAGWVAWVPLKYMMSLVSLVSRAPGGTFSVPHFSGALVWAYYGVLAAILLVPGGPRTLLKSTRGSVSRGMAWARTLRPLGAGLRPPAPTYLLGVIVALAAVAGVLWWQVAQQSEGMLHVYFLDVGQGDSVLIVTPGGRQVLVDGGPGPLGAASALGQRLGPGDRDLDLVVLTHPDEDHFRGLLEVVERYRVEPVLEGVSPTENPLFLEWTRVLEERGTRRVQGVQGQAVQLDEATRLEVLAPPPGSIRGAGSPTNNNGLVLKLRYGRISFLLAADIEVEAEDHLLDQWVSLESTVLKVAHHGSRTSSTPGFLAAVGPAATVISVGTDNRHGHPHPEVMARLEGALGEGRTYLTSERGQVEFITDGQRLWVKTDR